MKTAFCLLFSMALAAAPLSAQTAGRVVDRATGEGVPGASVRVENSTRGAAADADGHFALALQPADAWLVVTAVGYHPARVAAGTRPLVVRLAPHPVELDAVDVLGTRAIAGAPSAPSRTPATTDDLLARLPGVSLVGRGNFAREPVVRGYGGGQIALLVDGMPVYGACVDKMDPASSYVEPENLATVEVVKGAADLTRGGQMGGAVNLVTERPRFGVPLAFSGEMGVESQGLARRLRGTAGAAWGRAAVRASGSYRGAGNYAPGGRGATPGSGYQKRNLALAAALRLGAGTVTLQAIADDAWRVGYPALLMDATLARARIASAEYAGPVAPFDAFRLRLYRNLVRHAMDDRDRDVLARPVMRGMYMPMQGSTGVWGAQLDAERRLGATALTLTADLHRLRQFGDMWMYSLYPGVRDMYLLNVGDVRATNAGVSVGAERPLGAHLSLALSARLDASWRDVYRAEMRSIFAARDSTARLGRTLALPSASARLTYHLAGQTRLYASIADAGRLPTPVEQYGHYVYNYVDGYFYTGRPDLRPERSRQFEVGLHYAGSWLAFEAAAYAHRLRNIVVGVADPDVVPGLSGSTYRFRRYQNARSGWRAGGEASALLDARLLVEGLTAAASVSVSRGYNSTFHEPLPQMPPVGGVAAVRYGRRGWHAEWESRWALAQQRVARFTYGERPTGGFHVEAIRLGGLLWQGLSVEAGVENLFDRYYREHLALSSLAAQGRSVYVTLGLKSSR